MHMCVHKIFLSIVESELIIFISGPVVVSPAATIHFQADISNQNFLKWKVVEDKERVHNRNRV